MQTQSNSKETEPKFETLFIHAPAAIIVTNSQNHIVLVNNKASTLFGYKPNELIGNSILQIIPQEQHGLLNSISNYPTTLDIIVQAKNTDQFPAQINIANIKLDEGPHIVYLINDITPHKQIADRLQGQARELQKSNDELQDFAYIVSHDLRAPLRAVNTYSRFLAEDFGDELGEDGHEYITGITESAKNMDALIAGLLAYARIDRQASKPAPINCQNLLTEIVKSLNPNVQAKITLPQNAPTVWGYEILLQQMFSHLLDNALKFVDENVQPEIVIDFAEDNEFVTFSIQDNGIGIAQTYFDKIFGIFQRLHTADEFEGTGVGLAIAKKTVEKHGGKIWVKSAAGKGTTFFVTIPKMPPA